MDKDELRMQGSEIAQNEARNADLVYTSGVMTLIPDILNSVSFDKKYVLNLIESELNKPTANLLNAFLSLFGLKLICTQRTMDGINGELENAASYTIAEEKSEKTAGFISLDADMFRKTANEIAKRLSDYEKENAETADYLKKQNAELHGQLEKKEKEYHQTRSDLEGYKKSTADRVQYILSLTRNDEDGRMNGQMNELLTDLDMKAVWPEDKGELPRDAMFTILKCADPEKHKAKPCIIADGRVMAKGLVFTQDEAAGQ